MGTKPVRRAPVRAVRAALVAAGVALATALPAHAHPILTPGSIGVDAETRIVTAIPNEREGHATVAFTLSFPPGFTVVDAERTGPWLGSADARTASWSGGSITGTSTVEFALLLTAVAPTGTYDVVLDQRYDDGRSVTTKAPIIVLPALGEAAPDQHVGRAIAAAVVGILIVGGSLLTLRLLRRRPVG